MVNDQWRVTWDPDRIFSGSEEEVREMASGLRKVGAEQITVEHREIFVSDWVPVVD